jgi:hypothetical protein
MVVLELKCFFSKCILVCFHHFVCQINMHRPHLSENIYLPMPPKSLSSFRMVLDERGGGGGGGAMVTMFA